MCTHEYLIYMLRRYFYQDSYSPNVRLDLGVCVVAAVCNFIVICTVLIYLFSQTKKLLVMFQHQVYLYLLLILSINQIFCVHSEYLIIETRFVCHGTIHCGGLVCSSVFVTCFKIKQPCEVKNKVTTTDSATISN